MIIGIDFDNTLVSYDTLFHKVAREQGLIPPDLPATKTAVRDHLRATGREAVWTEMQGTVYGARIAEAEPYPGALDLIRACHRERIAVRIISHKTRRPYQGEGHDLHAAAQGWLQQHHFLDTPNTGIGEGQVFFEPTKSGKLNRIATCGCTHFIDDLPELLAEPAFPKQVERFLFDPQDIHGRVGKIGHATDWASLQRQLLGAAPLKRSLLTFAGRCGLKVASGPLQPIQGGANNRVFRLPLADGTAALVKHYFQHPGDPRDRFAIERAFYRYAGSIELPQVPTVLGWDETERLGLFSFVEGRTPLALEPGQIDDALEFFSALNYQRHRPEAQALPTAAEACFSLEGHLNTVQRRIDQMAFLPVEDALDADARHFVQHDLVPAWTAISNGLRGQYSLRERTQVLRAEERCVSTSDFGFHNCLVTDDGRTVFFDFEYAGWDDPAKLVGDFFCQPDVPVPRTQADRFVMAVAAALDLPDPAALAARCAALLPVYQIKWSCILLNEFTGAGRERRIFSLGAPAATERRSRQLARARLALNGLLQAA